MFTWTACLRRQRVWAKELSLLKFSCQGDNQITGESMCTSRGLGGAVLSFQMVGITRHYFFSSFESIAVPCPTTIHALKNYEAPGAVGDWTTFLCWLKGPKPLFLEHTMAISRTAGLHIVSFCFRDKGDRGDLENAQITFLSVAHLCTHVNNLKSKHFENSESVNFLSD